MEKLSIVARDTGNAVLIMDGEGNFEWVNEGFTRVYGYTLDQLIEEKGPNGIGLSANPNFGEVIARFPVERKTVHYESLNITRQGKKVWSHTVLTPVFDPDGNLTRIVAIDSDITKIKESENKIKLKNREIHIRSRELQEAIKVARKEREAANVRPTRPRVSSWPE